MATRLSLIALLAGLASNQGKSGAAGKLTFDSTPAVMTSHIVAECSFTKSKRFRTTLSLKAQDRESGVVDVIAAMVPNHTLLSAHPDPWVKCRIRDNKYDCDFVNVPLKASTHSLYVSARNGANIISGPQLAALDSVTCDQSI